MSKVVRTEKFPITIIDDRPINPDLPECWNVRSPQRAVVIVGYDENDEPVESITVRD